MNDEQKIKVESIVFKKLIEHLQNRTDVQNIDLMNLSGFCRNCLSRWYTEAAEETGLKVNKGAIGSVGSYNHIGNIKYYITSIQWRYQAKVCLLCAVCCASIFFFYCQFCPV